MCGVGGRGNRGWSRFPEHSELSVWLAETWAANFSIWRRNEVIQMHTLISVHYIGTCSYCGRRQSAISRRRNWI